MQSRICDIFTNICEKKEIRQNLALLRSQLKDKTRGDSEKESLLCSIREKKSVLEEILVSDDAKTRKNAALLIEDLNLTEYGDILFNAYRKESQYYVRTAMLSALVTLKYEAVPDELITIRNNCFLMLESESSSTGTDNSKHIIEEICILSGMLKHCGAEGHIFTGFRIPTEMILVTNRNLKSVVKKSLGRTMQKDANAGVMIKSNDIRDIIQLRTVNEFLFVINDTAQYDDDAEKAAQQLLKNGLAGYLNSRHEKIHNANQGYEAKMPFLFRVEAKYPEDTKPEYVQGFIKKFAGFLMKGSNFELINSTSDYEAEIRVIKRSNGKLGILLKLFTIPDRRFSYRKNVNATSMRPVNAALAAEIAKPYFAMDAVRLDPFCGIGTLLIESCISSPAKIVYGIDISGETIEKAEENWSLARLESECHFIKKDMGLFTHNHQFDEIVTEPPALRGQYSQTDLNTIYIKLFEKAGELLKPGGHLIIWSHNRSVCRKYANIPPFALVKECEVSMVEGTDIFIIRKDTGGRYEEY